MMNFPSSIWLKHYCTACNASVKSQPAFANPSPVADSSIAPGSAQTPIQGISSSIPSPFSIAQSTTETEPTQQQAVQVIHDYYNAIARRNYEQAYAAWEENGAASQQSFEQFQQGFANTACITSEIGEPGRQEGTAGSTYIEIPVVVTALTRDETPQRFRGSYGLRRNNVPGSTAQQRRWHLFSANLS